MNTYDTITKWLEDDDDKSSSLFGYTLQTLRMTTTHPKNVLLRQQARDIIRAVDDHDAKRPR